MTGARKERPHFFWQRRLRCDFQATWLLWPVMSSRNQGSFHHVFPSFPGASHLLRVQLWRGNEEWRKHTCGFAVSSQMGPHHFLSHSFRGSSVPSTHLLARRIGDVWVQQWPFYHFNRGRLNVLRDWQFPVWKTRGSLWFLSTISHTCPIFKPYQAEHTMNIVYTFCEAFNEQHN